MQYPLFSKENLRHYWPMIHTGLTVVLAIALIGTCWQLANRRIPTTPTPEVALAPYYVYQPGSADQYLNLTEQIATAAATPTATATATVNTDTDPIDATFAQYNPFLPSDISLGIKPDNATSKAGFQLVPTAYAAGSVPVIYYILRTGGVSNGDGTYTNSTLLMELNVKTGVRRQIKKVSNVIQADGHAVDYKDFYGVRFNQAKQLLALSATADTPDANQHGLTKLLLVDPTGEQADMVISESTDNVTAPLWSPDGTTLFYLDIATNQSLTAYSYDLASHKLTQLTLTGDTNLSNGSGVQLLSYDNNTASWSNDSKAITFNIIGRDPNALNDPASDSYSVCTLTMDGSNVKCLAASAVPNQRFKNPIKIGDILLGRTITKDLVTPLSSNGGPYWMATINAPTGAITEFKDTTFKMSDFAYNTDATKVIIHAGMSVVPGTPAPTAFTEYRIWDRTNNKVTDLVPLPAEVRDGTSGATSLIGFNGNSNNILVVYANQFWNYQISTKTWTQITH